jgi:hypothetical protein
MAYALTKYGHFVDWDGLRDDYVARLLSSKDNSKNINVGKINNGIGVGTGVGHATEVNDAIVTMKDDMHRVVAPVDAKEMPSTSAAYPSRVVVVADGNDDAYDGMIDDTLDIIDLTSSSIATNTTVPRRGGGNDDAYDGMVDDTLDVIDYAAATSSVVALDDEMDDAMLSTERTYLRAERSRRRLQEGDGNGEIDEEMSMGGGGFEDGDNVEGADDEAAEGPSGGEGMVDDGAEDEKQEGGMDDDQEQEEMTDDDKEEEDDGGGGGGGGGVGGGSSHPVDGDVFDGYEYAKGDCDVAGEGSVPCAPPNLQSLCNKYDRSDGSFRACIDACKPAFCCIHDAPSDINYLAPNCNTDPNCPSYAYCYIAWWKIHDTIGPALFLRVEQDDDFYDMEADEFDKYMEADEPFRIQVLLHHFDDIDEVIADGVVDNEFNVDRIILDEEYWSYPVVSVVNIDE